MAPEWYNTAMAEYDETAQQTESEGSGYYDSEGDYVPGPDDFDGEDDWDDDE